ncbi:MAG: protein kinase [Deltaproteobacteria bacterium]|nr:protein kinase [Deltaproteobacteria bacterium]
MAFDPSDPSDGGSVAGVWGPPAPPELPRFDGERYERSGLLGVGGMGRVFVARDLLLERDVALKECRPDAPAHGRARLQREARITARLEHPGILPVYDAGRADDGSTWYVMRLVRGETLAERIDEQPLNERLRALRPMLSSCQAMAYAHSRSIAHRDLKPENILVGAFGETQVADWGLAIPLEDGVAVEGGAVGTAGYMSPEQQRGEPATPRSDVWSLGAMLFEIATGQRAKGSPPGSVTGAAALENSGCPPALAGIVRKATATRPEDRYDDGADLAEDLARFLDGRRVAAHDYSAAELLGRLVRLWRAPIAVGFVAAVLLAAAIAIGWTQAASERRQAEAHLASALSEQALAEEADDELDHAEALAREALSWAESPAARGLLARNVHRPRPLLTDSHPGAAGCDQALLLDEGWICRKGGTLEARSAEGAPLWRREFDQEFDLSSVPGGLYVGILNGPMLQLDPRSGADLDRWSYPTFADGVVVREDGQFSAAWRGQLLGLNRPSGDSTRLPWCESAGNVAAAAFAPKRLLVVCADSRFGYFDPETPPEELTETFPDVEAIEGMVAALHLRDDVFAVVRTTGHVALVDFGARVRLSTHQVADHSLTSAVWAPDRESLVVRTERGEVYVWRLGTGDALRLPLDHTRDVRFADDGSLRLLGPELQRWTLPPPGPSSRHWQPGGVTALDLVHGAVVAARGTGRVTVWSPGERSVVGHAVFGGVIKDVAVEPGGRTVVAVASVPEPFAAKRLDLTSGTVVDIEVGGSFRRVAHIDGYGVAGLSYGPTGVLRVLARETASPSWGEEPHFDLAAAGPFVALRALSGRMTVADGSEGVVTPIWQEDLPGRGPVAITTSGRSATTLDEGIQWFSPAGQPLGVLGVDRPGATALAFSPDGSRLAAGDLEGAVRIWRLEDGTLLAEHQAHSGRVSSVRFLGDGELFSAGWDGAVLRWGLADLERDRLLVSQEGP